MPSVRVYGPERGISSFSGITRGALEGLGELGCLAGFYPTDSDLDEEVKRPGGAEADVGLMFGVPNLAPMMNQYARHQLRFCVVAPNSSQVPVQVFRWIKAGKAELLAPSAWAQNVLRDLAPTERVGLLPHGVPSAWASLPPREAKRQVGVGWSVLHVTSTASDRKSTLACVETWGRLQDAGKLSVGDRLYVLADERSGALLGQMVQGVRLKSGAQVPGVTVWSGRGVPWENWPAFVRQFDLVLQPSRAEGFGLLPLESLCLGVPVCATLCTGHASFLRPADGAVVQVFHGPESDIEDGDGAVAPIVDANAIFQALARARNDQALGEDVLRREAMASAKERARAWSWASVLGQWLRTQVAPRLG